MRIVDSQVLLLSRRLICTFEGGGRSSAEPGLACCVVAESVGTIPGSAVAFRHRLNIYIAATPWTLEFQRAVPGNLFSDATTLVSFGLFKSANYKTMGYNGCRSMKCQRCRGLKVKVSRVESESMRSVLCVRLRIMGYDPDFSLAVM